VKIIITLAPEGRDSQPLLLIGTKYYQFLS
jgi:hypothetical protein